jgi:hypothetical protein
MWKIKNKPRKTFEVYRLFENREEYQADLRLEVLRGIGHEDVFKLVLIDDDGFIMHCRGIYAAARHAQRRGILLGSLGG